jgi:HTH-type transcriptional regulator, competence development regulator
MEKLFKKELKAFGKKLKSIRKAKGLSQLDVEIQSGISRTEISRIENGLRNIEFYTIVKLASALDVPIKDFFS